MAAEKGGPYTRIHPLQYLAGALVAKDQPFFACLARPLQKGEHHRKLYVMVAAAAYIGLPGREKSVVQASLPAEDLLDTTAASDNVIRIDFDNTEV